MRPPQSSDPSPLHVGGDGGSIHAPAAELRPLHVGGDGGGAHAHSCACRRAPTPARGGGGGGAHAHSCACTPDSPARGSRPCHAWRLAPQSVSGGLAVPVRLAHQSAVGARVWTVVGCMSARRSAFRRASRSGCGMGRRNVGCPSRCGTAAARTYMRASAEARSCVSQATASSSGKCTREHAGRQARLWLPGCDRGRAARSARASRTLCASQPRVRHAPPRAACLHCAALPQPPPSILRRRAVAVLCRALRVRRVHSRALPPSSCW